MSDDIKLAIRKYALDNARKYNGVPNQGAVVGKLLGERPELKSKLKELMADITKICNEVKVLPLEKQIEELQKVAPELLIDKKIVEEKRLKPLQDVVPGKVVMRLAPSPSGMQHIGHGVVFSLSHLYCREYQGKLILRIEDTNPEEIYEPAYEATPRDLNWLCENHIHAVELQSARLDTYYDYAEKLIAKGKAYVCTCSQDVFRDLSMKQKACPCRELKTQEQHGRWDRMFVEFEPGQAVLRIKTNLLDPNPAMRDWPAFRINHAIHPKTKDKYKVWPLMNFAVAIDDHEMGVTHTVRGKDHVDNAKRQEHIYQAFGWKGPAHAYIGKINFEGIEVSKRKIKAAIERGEFDDWDDIRLPFLAAMKRRGFQPGAFHRFAMDMGIGLNDKTVPAEDFFKSLEAHNRDIIDPVANRYFFVDDPQKITVKDAPKQEIKIRLHPDDDKRGQRSFTTHQDFYVPKNDWAQSKAKKMYRLMDCLNFIREGAGAVFNSTDYDTFKHKGEGTMHWLPADAKLPKVEVLMPDKKLKVGLGEPALLDLKEGTMVQFERFGFCRLDKKEKDKLTFWFAHK